MSLPCSAHPSFFQVIYFDKESDYPKSTNTNPKKSLFFVTILAKKLLSLHYERRADKQH